MRNLRQAVRLTTDPYRWVTRRRVGYLLISGTVVSVTGVVGLVGERSSVSISDAMQFIQHSGDRLIAILNGAGETSEKMRQSAVLIAETVDVDGVVRFVLGRYWNVANNDQRREFVRLFPVVLIGSIGRSVGAYQGLSFTVDRGVQIDNGIQVWTTVLRPGDPPRRVTWIISVINGAPKITDIIAEGASMRITERDDCASFLAQNNHSIPALIDTLRRQAESTS